MIVNVPLPGLDWADGYNDGYDGEIIIPAFHSNDYMAGYNEGVRDELDDARREWEDEQDAIHDDMRY